MSKTAWTETCRAMVKAWECDAFEHFTVAFYYERIADAVLNLFDEVEAGPAHALECRHALTPVATVARFEAELLEGDIHHVESGLVGRDGEIVRTGHKLFNSANGRLAAAFTLAHRYLDLDARKAAPMPDSLREAIDSRLVEWDRPPDETRPGPRDESGFIDSGRDTVKPWEVDVLGHLSLPGYLHRFSDANMHVVARFGMTPAYLRENRIGFSTFEFQGRLGRELRVGDRILIRSGLMHVGGSSMRILHRMYSARTRGLCAEFSQYGVHLDLDARRPTRLPEEMRARAADLVCEPGAPGT